MKILHIINSLDTGGAEKLILETLPIYAKYGNIVDVLLLNGTPHPFLVELAAKKCCRIFSLGNSSVYHPKNIFGIIPYLRKYEIVHVHLFPAQHFVALAKILSSSKSKFVFTEHSTNNRRFNNRVFKLLDKIIYNQYHKIIAITDEVQNRVVKHTGFSSKEIVVIQNGISLNKIHSAAPYKRKDISANLTESDILMLQVSSFQEPKDQATVIKAMVHLPDHYKLIFVGGGNLQQKAIELVKSFHLQSRVFFLGIRNDIPRLLKSVDIIVLSSKYEGLSLSCIEGMASGKPFIASEVPGLSDVVGGAGILFPFEDEKKLAEKILLLMVDQYYYNSVVARCMERSNGYDIKVMADKYITLYKDLTK